MEKAVKRLEYVQRDDDGLDQGEGRSSRCILRA